MAATECRQPPIAEILGRLERPPCYAERTVPDLLIRMRPVHASGGLVLLSGHSQGSVLAAAAALQLSPAEQRRSALLTYGSPLRRL
jgi:hypothetical protein